MNKFIKIFLFSLSLFFEFLTYCTHFRLLLVLFSFVYEDKKKVKHKFIILCSHFCMFSSSIIEEKSNSFFLN